MLRLEGVHAFYGPVQVLFSIDLEVRDGEIVALLGTNGAGKTTILRVISGVMKPALGDVVWNDESIKGLRPPEVLRRGIVQMPGGRGVFPGMSVQENLEVAGFSFGRDASRLRTRIEAVLEAFPLLAERRRQVAGSLSGGQQQMLTLAKSFIVEPKLLLVDELSLGLAPKIVDVVFEALAEIRSRGITVLLVEQRAQRTVEFSDRTYLLANGEIRLTLSPADASDTQAMVAAYLS